MKFFVTYKKKMHFGMRIAWSVSEIIDLFLLSCWCHWSWCLQLQCGGAIVIPRSVIVLWKKLWNLTKFDTLSPKIYYIFRLWSWILLFFMEHAIHQRGKWKFMLHQHQPMAVLSCGNWQRYSFLSSLLSLRMIFFS